MDRVSDDAVAAGLVGLPGCERVGDTIEATFTLRSFPAAVECIVAIADRAEAMNHHPDLDLRYRRLRVVCSTHDAGGLTELDLALAAAVSVIAGELA